MRKMLCRQPWLPLTAKQLASHAAVASSTVDLTVTVDMSQYTSPFTTAYISGDFNGWITSFDGVSVLRGGGFHASSGIYTVPEDGIYIFGLKARSGSQLTRSRIDFYKNNVAQTVVADGNVKDKYNNLGTTWTDTLKKGDKLRLKVYHGTVNGYIHWWGVRIFAN